MIATAAHLIQHGGLVVAMLGRRVREERGATAVEYAIMLVAIVAVIILAVVALGDRTVTNFDCTRQAIATRGATNC